MTPIWTTFCEVADRAPDVEAILSPGRQPLRFRDLPRRLESVRDALAALGIGPGDRVVSVLPRGPETAVCYLGTAACATYVPLNPDFSEAEFTTYFTRLRPAAVILPAGAGNVARESASALGIRIVDLVSSVADPAGVFTLVRHSGPDSEPRAPRWNGPDDFALVLLTSGSTSSPKAVPLRVRHLLSYARHSGAHYGLGPADRYLHVMPMFHGHGLKAGLLGPLSHGSGVIVSPDFDVPTFFQQMKTMRPTWYSAAASIHQAILSRVDDYREIARDARLRFIRSGSSRLDPKVSAGLERAFQAPVIEQYGMSETGALTFNPLPPGIRKPGSVGTRTENEVAIIDEQGRVLGPNCVGEIVARGPCVFDGYLDDPEANKAAFINGWFRTGDLGRFDDDGYLTLTGRLKDVINRGGEKIGTAEIEAALLRHPEVTEACAFALPHPSLGEEVAAAVVTRRVVTELELQAYARGLLTNMKVPRRICFLPSLPKSASKKINRAETAAICRKLIAAKGSDGPDANRPWSALEQEIAAMWKRLLDIETVGLDDDFFLIGGDSLKAYELFAHLQKAHRIMLGLGQIFDEAATIAGMARLIERALRDRANAPLETAGLVTIKANGDRPPLFAVSGSGGNPVGFIHLGRLLDARQPLVGLESRGLDGAREPLARMEDIAADNVARIRTIQPSGPYFLVGMCFGGRVVYEMARQLEASGERIGGLFMVDASAPFRDRKGRWRGEVPRPLRTSKRFFLVRFVLDRMKKHASSFMRLRGAKRAAFVGQKLATVAAMIRLGDPFRGDRTDFNHKAVRAANRHAGNHYVPGRYGGPAILYLAQDRKLEGRHNYRLDWLTLVPQIGAPIYISGANSGEVLNLPHIYQLADAINSQLEAIHAENESALRSARHLVSAR